MQSIDFVKTDCSDSSCQTGVTFLLDAVLFEQCENIPNDLTGYTAKIAVYDGSEDSIVTTIIGAIAEPLNGKIHFELSATATALLPVGMYSHHIEITSAAGVVYRLAEGCFEITQ